MTQAHSTEEWSLGKNLVTDPDHVASEYDNMSVQYESSVTEWGYAAPKMVASYLQRYDVSSESKILDAGCGVGMAGTLLTEAGFGNLFGIDISPNSLAMAEQTGAYRQLQRWNLHQTPLPFAENEFDAIVCVGVLSYVPKLRPLFEDFCRIVRPGGIVIYTQRDDYYEERQNAPMLAQMEAAGWWQQRLMSDKRPYLPNHGDYGSAIQIYYFVYQVN